MSLLASPPGGAHLKALDVEEQAEGLYDHGGPLAQWVTTAGTQLPPADRPANTHDLYRTQRETHLAF